MMRDRGGVEEECWEYGDFWGRMGEGCLVRRWSSVSRVGEKL